MRIIARKTLRDYWEKNKDAENPLKAWFQAARKANWQNFNELKKQFAGASLVGNDRVVFNIKGNDYRLVARIHFKSGKMFIRFVGTHRQYDKTDVSNI